MKTSTLKKTVLILTLYALSLGQKTVAQSWSAQVISPGKFEIDITPSMVMGYVSVNISLYNERNELIREEDRFFTNSKVKYLKPGNTYAKHFSCDSLVVKVVGNYIRFSKEGSGDKADDIGQRIEEKSKSTVTDGNKVIITDKENTRDHRRKDHRTRDHRTRDHRTED